MRLKGLLEFHPRLLRFVVFFEQGLRGGEDTHDVLTLPPLARHDYGRYRLFYKLRFVPVNNVFFS